MGDFTVAAPFSKSYCVGAAKKTGYAAGVAIKRKKDKYDEACKKVKVRFIPAAMETHGYMSPQLLSLITLAQKKIRSSSSSLAAYHASNFARYWKIRLSVEFMKSTAEAVLARQAGILHPSNLQFSESEVCCFFEFPDARAIFSADVVCSTA